MLEAIHLRVASFFIRAIGKMRLAVEGDFHIFSFYIISCPIRRRLKYGSEKLGSKGAILFSTKFW